MSEVVDRARSVPRLEAVQMLRALAAFAVVMFHIPVFGNGAWGVELFFVISGFIVCYVTAASGKDFLKKRWVRVVPLYWVGTFAVFLVAWVAPSLLQSTSADGVELLKSLFFIPFRKGENVQPILYLGWTLNYEMFFYLVFWVAMNISHRYRAWLASVAMASLSLAGALLVPESDLGRFYTSPLLVLFASGMILHAVLFRGFQPRFSPPSRPRQMVAWAAIASGVVVLVLVSNYVTEKNILLLWGVPSVVMMAAALVGLWGVAMPKVVLDLGDASYSLYLFHPYVIKVAEVAAVNRIQNHVAQTLLYSGVVVGCCVLAVLCYRWVEAPLTRELRTRLHIA